MDKLGLRELLRYGYTGVLCALVAAIVAGTRTEQLVKHLGDVLSPLAVLAVGTAVYLVFRTVVGELFLWRLIDWSHAKAEDLLRRPATRCKVRYLQDQHGVPRGQGLDAYVLVRDSLLSEAERERFHVQHSESYILFVTAFVCGLVSLLAYVDLLPSVVSSATFSGLGVAAAIAFGAGGWHDIFLCRAECAAIGMLPREKVDATIRGGGFVAHTKPAITPTDGE